MRFCPQTEMPQVTFGRVRGWLLHQVMNELMDGLMDERDKWNRSNPTIIHKWSNIIHTWIFYQLREKISQSHISNSDTSGILRAC